MDITTLIGCLAGILLIVGGICFDAKAMAIDAGVIVGFIDVPSMVIVVGGTFAALANTSPMSRLKKLGNVSKNLIKTSISEPQQLINDFFELAETSRRNGILALESSVETMTDDFMKRGIQLAIDGGDAKTIEREMEAELTYLQGRHEAGKRLYDSLGKYAPAFGMIGTLIGLVKMLGSLDDPSTIGPSMAVALVTTFYGAVMANLFFLPLADKLDVKSQDEVLIKEMIIKGVLSIQKGDNPKQVKQRLNICLPPDQRVVVE